MKSKSFAVDKIIFLVLLFIGQEASLYAQTSKLNKWKIKPANYSGITYIGDSLYAVVDDKENRPGFFVWKVTQDVVTGDVMNVESLGFRGLDSLNYRDAEGIAYVHPTNTLWISGEKDQSIIEHNITDGLPTGRKAKVPSMFSLNNIQHNRGFEALGYDHVRNVLWTCTESSLRTDTAALIRLQSVTINGDSLSQYLYYMDAPQAKNEGRNHTHGVSSICVEDDGTLLVLEREIRITKRYVGTCCWCKLYRYSLETGTKQLVDSWKTKINLLNTRFANYEGMCLGQPLADGRQTLLLISDSQAHAGRLFWHLKDYIKVIIL